MPKKQRLNLNPSMIAFSTVFFLLIIALDRLSKLWILSWPVGHTIRIAPYIDFVLVKNQGIAFGLLSDANLNFILISLISLALLCVIFFYFLPIFPLGPFILITAGAIGNIIDRMLYGFVVDFIKIHAFYVFNIADAAITIGSILLVYLLIFDKKTNEYRG